MAPRLDMPTSLQRTCILLMLTMVLQAPCPTWAVHRAIPWLMHLEPQTSLAVEVNQWALVVPNMPAMLTLRRRGLWVQSLLTMATVDLSRPCPWVLALLLPAVPARAATLVCMVARLVL